MANEGYNGKISNESRQRAPIQRTLSYTTSTKHPQFHRSYSCHQQAHKILHPVGRYNTFQVPDGPYVCNSNSFNKIHPTKHVVSNGNKMRNVTQMTLPVKAVKQPIKEFTYSLDRSQIQGNNHQNSRQDSHLYQDLNGNILLIDFCL